MAAPDISTLSTEPDQNGNLGGINIAENCPAGNVNNGMRWLAAAVAVLRGQVPNTTNFMPKSGGAFTANPTFSGKGGYLYNASNQNPGGQVYFQPQGSALPSSGTDGDMVIFYQ